MLLGRVSQKRPCDEFAIKGGTGIAILVETVRRFFANKTGSWPTGERAPTPGSEVFPGILSVSHDLGWKNRPWLNRNHAKSRRGPWHRWAGRFWARRRATEIPLSGGHSARARPRFLRLSRRSTAVHTQADHHLVGHGRHAVKNLAAHDCRPE